MATLPEARGERSQAWPVVISLALFLPLGCGRAENSDSALGDCPTNPGQDLELSQVARGHYGTLNDASSREETTTFTDYDSLNAWWAAVDESNTSPIGGDVDFSSMQAVALLTSYDSESDEGTVLDGIQWSDDREEELLFRVDDRCGGNVESDTSWWWEVFATPIAPASACHMEACSVRSAL